MTDRYVQRADYSAATIGVYVFIGVVLLLIGRAGGGLFTNQWYAFFFVAVVVIFLARYLSTRYWIDADRMGAWRIFGTRKIELDRIRKIEYASLRDLGGIGFFGSWGWRGRVWSPVIGRFDAIYTNTAGLLITAGAVPLFISPKDPQAFARELSRRVRSYSGHLTIDVGDPEAQPPTPKATAQ
jgi:hypothetical protein